MVIFHFTKDVMLHLATVVDMPNACLFKSRLLWWNRVARLSLIFMTDDLLTIFIHRSPERCYWCWITWFGCGPTGWVLEPHSFDIHICAHFFDPPNPLVNQTASPKMIVPHHIPWIYVKHILKSMINHDWLIYGYNWLYNIYPFISYGHLARLYSDRSNGRLQPDVAPAIQPPRMTDAATCFGPGVFFKWNDRVYPVGKVSHSYGNPGDSLRCWGLTYI